MMKRRLILLLGFGFVLIIGILAVIIYWPGSTEALNPDHGSCAICHSLHGAPGQKLSNDAVVEVLCLSCHGPAGIATKKAEVHTNKDGSSHAPFFITCTGCHNPHDDMGNRFGGTNLAQVGKKLDGTGYAMIPTPNSGDRYVVFESRGSGVGGPTLHSFADADEDGDTYYDGVCETCHTAALNHRNNPTGDHGHPGGSGQGGTCVGCHPHVDKFLGTGGGCSDCHSSIFSEFSGISHHVLAGSVTEDDCQVCHQEPVSNHQDGDINLKDPDTGAALTPFLRGSTRNTASDTLEPWVVEVQNNLCLKCHDSDGAVATNFSGNPLRPFSVGNRDVPDVFNRFSTSNNYHHSVRGAGNNPYCVPSGTNGNNITMEPPWNQDATHDVITCFDCHETTGHGSAHQRMLLDPIDFDGLEAAVDRATIPASSRCHKAALYLNERNPETAGSIFESHGGAVSNHTAAGANEMGCMGCHGGIKELSGGVPASGNGSSRGNIHGGSFSWPQEAAETFMVGGFLSDWFVDVDNKGNPEGRCNGGDCNHSGSGGGQKYPR
jgi:predicted CXXCH cytochrome family protein